MSGFSVSRKWSKTEMFLESASESRNIYNVLDRYGQIGIERLAEVTPKLTGLTASSWGYEIEKGNEKTSLVFTNFNVNKGVNIAIILQYGHGTRNGGYVEGVDYINPALRPLFEQMLNDIWKEVTNT